MLLHVIDKFPILFDKQLKRTLDLDGVIAEVNASTMLEYMDDNVEILSFANVVVGS
jgi:hypothetical protein